MSCHPLAELHHAACCVQATVGAGLPVIATLKHLRETGDRVVRVEGIFSGTLSYIFNTYRPGTSFSEVVAQAKAQGYTEPDPRDDLAGADVARKVTILARWGPLAAARVRRKCACIHHACVIASQFALWGPLPHKRLRKVHLHSASRPLQFA